MGTIRNYVDSLPKPVRYLALGAFRTIVGLLCAFGLIWLGGAAYLGGVGLYNYVLASVRGPIAPLAGTWRFKTHTYGDQMTLMTGIVQIGPDRTGQDCTMRTSERTQLRGYIHSVSSVQSCAVTKDKDNVTILSTVESSSSESYVPDNFLLSVERKNRMRGKLQSSVDATVVFVRQGAENSGILPWALFEEDRDRAAALLNEYEDFGVSVNGCLWGYRTVSRNPDPAQYLEISEDASIEGERYVLVSVRMACRSEYNGVNVTHQDEQVLIECESERTKDIDYAIYSGEGNRMVGGNLGKPSGLDQVESGTVDRNMVQAVCGN